MLKKIKKITTFTLFLRRSRVEPNAKSYIRVKPTLRIVLLNFLILIAGLSSSIARDLYWIGQDANWHNGANWSLHSGGQPIYDIPNEHDDVFFDSKSFNFSNQVQLSQNAVVKNFQWSSSVVATLLGNGALTVYGSLEIQSSYINQFYGNIYFKGYEANVVNVEQSQLHSSLYFQGSGTYTLLGNLATSDHNSIQFESGNFNANGKILYTGRLLTIGNLPKSIIFNSRVIVADYIKLTGNNQTIQAQNGELEFIPVTRIEENDLNDVVFGSMTTKASCSGGLTVTAAVTSNYNGSQISCGGDCDGEITVTASGTPGPFGYSLSGVPCGGNPTSCSSRPTNVFTGLCAGTYNANVVDSSQLLVPVPPIYLTCTEFGVVIVAPPLIEVSVLFIQNPSCPTSCDGQIFTSIGGGTGSLDILWPNIPSTVSNPTGVCTGVNPITVTDQNGCAISDIVTVADPPGILANLQIVGVSCDGVCNGAAFSNPTGGNGGPYFFEWTDLSTNTVLGNTNPVSDLCEIVNYRLDIQDNNGCQYDTVFSLVDKVPPTMNVDFTQNASCANLCDAQVGISFSGGTATVVQVDWYEGVLGSGTVYQLNGGFTQTALCPNTDYYIVYTDDEGCTDSIAVPVLNSPPPFNYSETHVDVNCSGNNNGSINVSLSGGTPGYTYVWSSTDGTGFLVNTQDQTGLSGGTYQIVYTDALGCTDSNTITIDEPDPIITSGVVTDVGCYNLTNGSIDITPIGGNGGYSFVWSSTPNGNLIDINTEDQSGLDSAFYTVTITDALGCTYDTTFNLTKPGEIYFNSVISPILCNGDNDAIIDHNPSNGVPPFSFAWSTTGGATLVSGAEDQTNLSPASYATIITDFNGCSKDTTIVITQPAPLTISASQVNNTCFQSNDASITLTIGGGTLPYTIVWNPSPTPIANNISNPTGLSAGDYTATVTDDNGCTNDVSITITEPQPLTVTLNATDLVCNGVNNGSVTTAVTGGTVGANYVYSWSGPNGFGSSLQNISGLFAGTYCLNVTDDNLCNLGLDSCVTITEPDSIYFGSTVVSEITCFGLDNASINIIATGGDNNFSYAWTSIGGYTSNSSSVTNLSPDTYTVVVTDGNGCANDTTFTFNEPDELVITTSNVPTSCTSPTGSVSVAPSGGTIAGNYIIQWSIGGVNLVPGNNLTEANLGVGCYDVLVTDDNGCNVSGQECLVSVNPPVGTATVQNTFCSGSCDGSINLSISAGTPPYTTTWSSTDFTFTDPGTANIFSLCEGDYTVTITDAANCSSILTETVAAPSIINITNAVVSPVSCTSTATGSIDITVSGGTVAGNYNYSWTGSNSYSATSEDAGGLLEGTYCVRITDDNGCFIDSCFVITEPTELEIVSISSTDAQCNVPSGSVSVVASGGTVSGNYSYSWVNLSNVVVGTTQTVNGVLNDVYTVTVTDDNGCSIDASVTVLPTNGPAIAVDGFTDVLCAGGSNGTITTSSFGGTGTLTYSWSSIPAGFTAGNVPNVSGLAGGTYVVSVSDGAACTSNEVIVISEPDPIQILFNEIDAICFGETGLIDITVFGGTSVSGTYLYDWSHNGTGAFVDSEDLQTIAGSYTVIVADDNGCTETEGPFTINEPSQINLVTNSTQSACTFTTGSVSVSATDGTPGPLPNSYTYAWFNSASGIQVGNTSTVNNLGAGCYDVVVTDFNGCTSTTNECVSDLNGPDLSALETNVTCFDGANGAVDLTVITTSGVQSIIWTSTQGYSANTEDISGLIADDYAVIVTENNGCTSGLTVSVTEPNQIEVSAILVNPICFGSPTGSIDITVNNAVLPISYQWSSLSGFASTTEDISNVIADSYDLTIIDGNGCQLDSTLILGPLPAIVITTSNSPTECVLNTGIVSASASGGVPGYSFVWTSGSFTGTNGSTESNLPAGTYTITVTDANGCIATATETINQINPPIISLNSVNDADCFGNSTGSVFVSVTSGTPAYTFNWTGPAGFINPGTEDLVNVPTGTYTLNVIDAASCTAGPVNFTVEEPVLPLTLSGVASDILCFGANNGSIDISVSGGTSPYTYNWNNGSSQFSSSQDVNGLSAGNYSVIVSDANGCSANDSFTISEPTELTVSATGSNSSCNTSDGNISSIANGGTGVVTYQWTDVNGILVPIPGGNVSDVNGVPQGSYQITVTDENGCTASDVATVSDFNGPVVSFTQVDILCFGDLTGQIDLTASGTIPLNYNWTGPSVNVLNANDEDLFGIQAGNYTVAVTDANNCVTNQAVNINGPLAPLTVNGVVTEASCFGVNDGEIDVTLTGGTSPYTVIWSGPNGFTSNFVDITNLEPGTYSIDITDNAGCVSNGNQFTLNNPDQLVITPVITEPSCGLSDGSVSVTASGGTVAVDYLYSWFDLTTSTTLPNTTNTISNIASGNFEITVSDDNGCLGVDVISVSDDNAAPLNFVVTNIDCNGNANGAIDLTVTGTNPYDFTWTTANGSGLNPISEDQSGLTPGNYNVSVFDPITGCTSNGSAAITEPLLLSATAITSNLSCFNDNTGSIDITISGGTLPYTIDWDNIAGTSNSEDQLGIAAGTYEVLITDLNGCQFANSYILTEPNQIVITGSTTDNNCFGESLGTIDLTVADGIAPYVYAWSNGSSNEDLSNLAAGTYNVLVTDDNGCNETASFTINEPDNFVFAITTGNSSCLVATGSATSNVSGGTLVSPDYTYNWVNGGATVGTTNTINNQFSGLYTLFVTDDNGCSGDTTVSIIDNNAPTLTLDNTTDIDCHGNATGSIFISTTGGNAPYSYLWNPGAVSQLEDLTGVPAGTYTLIVTDADGCSNTISASLSESDELSATLSSVNSTCGICNASATVSGSGGAGSYTYVWSTGATTATVNNLCAGVYTIEISDALGCSVNETVVINDAGGPTGEIINSVDATCNGSATGSAIVDGVGGVLPYNYFWPHNSSTNNAQNNLLAGTYFVQIIDNNGCIRNAQVDIDEPGAITASATTLPATCGGNDGSITVSTNGGIAPLSFNWNGGLGTNPNISGLSQGIYTVTITDNIGCSIVRNFTVPGINAPSVSLTPFATDCFNSSTGSISSSVSGAIGALTYQWFDAIGAILPGEIGSTIAGLPAGDYTIEVIDAGTGCASYATTTISSPVDLTVTLPNIIDASCLTACNGQATAIISGGTLPYSYLWSSGSTSATANNLCVGINSVTVADANGCIIQQSITVDENATLTAVNSTNDASCGSCNGSATVTPSGGSGNYSVLWADGITSTSVNGLCAGIYSLEVTDNATGCATQLDVTINNIDGPDNDIVNSTDVTCNGGADGSAQVSVSGGTTPYQYNWIGQGIFTNSINNLTAGNYVLQVSDNNGCIRMVPVTIQEPDSPNVSYIANDGTCGLADGEITLVITQGNAPYSVNWISGPSAVGSNNIQESNLLPGNYTIDITDNQGCISTEIIPLGTTNGPLLSISSANVGCEGFNDGSAQVNAVGNGPFTFVWSNGGASDVESNLMSGYYTVSVTDNLGCVSNASATITEPSALIASLPNIQDASCDVSCDGQATVLISGGTLSYTYLWSNGESGATATNLCVGVNTVSITDANGCFIEQNVIIESANLLTSTFASVDAACGECNGESTVTVSGGSGNYSVLWYDNTNGITHSNLCAGIYSYAVTDLTTGCQTQLDATVNNVDGPDGESVTVTDVTCFGGSDGSATIVPTGGTLPYTYLWSPIGATTDNVNNLTAGTYYVEVSDSNDCKRVVPVVINEPSAIDINYIAVNPNCGFSDGSISTAVQNVSNPVSYNWSGPGGFTTNVSSASGLTAGIYIIQVTDNTGCSRNISVTLNSTSATPISVSASHISCNGLSDGTATVTTAGNFNYLWSSGGSGASETGLGAGQYFVEVTDNTTGCITTEMVNILEPQSLQFGSHNVNNTSCFAACDGSITALANGGTVPYSFSWSTGSNLAFTDNICVGTYTINIEDANGCSITEDVDVTEPDELIITVDNVIDAQCVNSTDGAIDVTVTGGTPDYAYEWTTLPGTSFTSAQEDISNLLPMNYELSVTDANGCIANVSVAVDTLHIVIADAGVNSFVCLNDCVVLTGIGTGPGPLNYEWQNTAGITLSLSDTVAFCGAAVGLDNLVLFVSDAVCSSTDTIQIETYPLPFANAGNDISLIIGAIVNLGGSPTGPSGSTFVWSPTTNILGSDETASNPQIILNNELDYVVFVTDTNGCENSDTINVRPIPMIVFPNGFTPNGDGVNDDWQIDNIEQFPNCVVEVYNRWGQQLFYSVGYTTRWDGRYNNEELPVGTYYYIIELNDPLFPEPYSGPITIMR
jgi:gliding motility-associated-like protein